MKKTMRKFLIGVVMAVTILLSSIGMIGCSAIEIHDRTTHTFYDPETGAITDVYVYEDGELISEEHFS